MVLMVHVNIEHTYINSSVVNQKVRGWCVVNQKLKGGALSIKSWGVVRCLLAAVYVQCTTSWGLVRCPLVVAAVVQMHWLTPTHPDKLRCVLISAQGPPTGGEERQKKGKKKPNLFEFFKRFL